MDRSGEHITLCKRCQHSVELPSSRPIDPLLLHSSHGLTEAEYTQTVDTLEEEMQQLQRYEDTIGHLHRSLEKMEDVKQELEDHIKRRRSIISVQRRIPAEIWETIFAFTCSFSSTHGYSLTICWLLDLRRNIVLTQVPIVLSHVCHRWRAIVTGFPRLWSLIKVNLTRGIPLGQKTLVETFLAKSEGCTLDLHVGPSNFALLEENCRVLVEMLMRHSPRCGALDLDLLIPPRGSHYSFPHLLSFRVRRSLAGGGEHNQPFWKALYQAPKLTAVHLSSFKSCHYALPYTQLTTLIIDFIDSQHVVELLKALEAATNLCSLSLGIREEEDKQGSLAHVARRIEMPLLRTLSLDLCKIPPNMDNLTFNTLLSSLVMPVMSQFKFAGERTISSQQNGTTVWSSLLLDMLRSSSSTLRHMTLRLYIFDYPLDYNYWEDLSVLFETTPRLTHLEVGSYGRGTDWTLISSFIHTVTTDGTQNNILPDLQYISFGPICLEDDLVQKTLDLAASRSFSRLSLVNGVQPLKELVIYYVNASFCPKPWMLEEIGRLRKDGLEVLMVLRAV